MLRLFHEPRMSTNMEETRNHRTGTDPIGRFAATARRIGEIEVTEWDFVELLHRDVGDLDVSRSLRRLGAIRVTDWEFKDVLPAVDRLAHKEVDLADVFRRTANYRVTEWEFRDMLHRHHEPVPREAASSIDSELMGSLASRLHGFLVYLMDRLIDHPDEAVISVEETEPGVLTAKLVLTRPDSAALIGRGGHTAAAIRRILQMAGLRHGVHVLLRIVSHDEEAAAVGA